MELKPIKTRADELILALLDLKTTCSKFEHKEASIFDVIRVYEDVCALCRDLQKRVRNIQTVLQADYDRG